MKKTLAAVAVLGAFAGSAVAADVTLYGKIDTGFRYNNVDTEGSSTKETFQMSTGESSGSRWGLKGTEDLGNGMKVGFVLESGFSSDTGMGNTELFNREASVSISGDFGKVLAGRMGTLVYGAGSVSKIGMLSTFGTSYGAYVPQVNGAMAFTGTRQNNAIAYESPKIGGLVIRAQYAMGNSKTGVAEDTATKAEEYVNGGVEGKSSTDRYYAIGATYSNGPANVFFAVDSVNYDSVDVQKDSVTVKDVDDSLTVTLGGNYDLGVAKVYAGVQYFDEVKADAIKSLESAYDGKIEGYGLSLSADTKVAGGTARVGLSYVDAEPADSAKAAAKTEITRWQIGAGYDYALSKRTYVYGVVGYSADEVETAGKTTKEINASTAMFGLVHNF